MFKFGNENPVNTVAPVEKTDDTKEIALEGLKNVSPEMLDSVMKSAEEAKELIGNITEASVARNPENAVSAYKKSRNIFGLIAVLGVSAAVEGFMKIDMSEHKEFAFNPQELAANLMVIGGLLTTFVTGGIALMKQTKMEWAKERESAE